MSKDKPDQAPSAGSDDLEQEIKERIAGGEIKAPATVGPKETSSPVAHDYTPAEDEKVMTRVFRVLMPRKLEAQNKGIVTLMTTKHIENGTEVPAQFKRLQPNTAYQYVLEDSAVEYQKQLAVLRKFERAGEIEEVPAKQRGVPFISEQEKELAKIEKRVRELKEELGMPE